MAFGLITCGEVEEVVGALSPVVSGVAQAFHDLLVELQLLLVAEEEERGRGRQTGGRLRSREWSRSSQKRQPRTCMAWRWGERCKSQIEQDEYE